MGKSKFIQSIESLFGITPKEDESKKKSIKELIQKLKERRILIKKALKEETDILKRDTLKDHLFVLKKQIKKGREILDD